MGIFDHRISLHSKTLSFLCDSYVWKRKRNKTFSRWIISKTIRTEKEKHFGKSSVWLTMFTRCTLKQAFIQTFSLIMIKINRAKQKSEIHLWQKRIIQYLALSATPKTQTINLWIIHLTSQATEPLLLSSYLIKPWHFDWPFKINSLILRTRLVRQYHVTPTMNNLQAVTQTWILAQVKFNGH